MFREDQSRGATEAPSTPQGICRRASVWDGGLRGFVSALEARSPGSDGHARRVASMSRLTAEVLGMDGRDALRVERAALVHDVGKIIVPATILEAPRELLPWEFEEVKRHANFGAQLVASLHDPQMTAIVRHHHERIDGSGYPDGLHGAAIPLGARIVAVADTFDALTSARPYRQCLSICEAICVIEAEAGATLDPVVVAAFLA
jgi:HD-GYP domain-containing protein (c-di-GMP phosphodiesterase class II)